MVILDSEAANPQSDWLRVPLFLTASSLRKARPTAGPLG